jgi:hypothetical protein
MSSSDQATAPKQIATWRKVVAAILDFIFIFAISGYVVASITGNTTEEGFDLKGGPAFVVFAIIILYFILFTRYLGGTIFQRLLRAR